MEMPEVGQLKDAMKEHLIVVSVDAMVYEDLTLLRQLPNIGGLMKTGSFVKHVLTIYPSLTHPVHATLMSGCTPSGTGVPNNVVFSPGNKSPYWYNNLSQVKCETLFHAAKRAGLTTASCRWPLTAGGFDVIDYLVPEVIDEQSGSLPDLQKNYQKDCSSSLYDDIILKNLNFLMTTERHPAYEEFSMRCAADIIRKYRPNLLMTHPGMVDHCRHETGLYSSSVEEALRMTDSWVGMLIEAARDAGIEDRTSFAIISDHGHREYVRVVAPNVLLVEQGWITLDAEGNVTDWQVYAIESGLSCQVYIKDQKNTESILTYFETLRRTGLYGFDEILTKEQCVQRYDLDGDFAFVLEGDGCTAFVSDWQGPYIRMNSGAGEGVHHSSHGHMPEKGPQPTMIVSGPAFQRGVMIEQAEIVDEAPTFAAALGFVLPQAQGHPLMALLRTNE